MTLLEEIRQFFATQLIGASRIKNLPDGFPAYVLRTHEWFGVAVEYNSDTAVSEHFANATFLTAPFLLAGEAKNLLLLTSYVEDLRNEFAYVCAQFVDPGIDGGDRASLLSDPLSWWKKWKTLLGNSISNRAPYSVICELLALEHVLCEDPSAEWTATKAGSHDIESPTRSCEVKSTIVRYGADVTISGQFQLMASKPLDLYFCRVEESPTGISINDMKERLVSAGYNESLLELQLAAQGYEFGSSDRDKKYSVLEKRLIHIDDKFPKLTEHSFKGDVIPKGISHITYTVDLDAVEHIPW